MSTIYQLREGLHEAWENLVDGWQRLYRRAAGAITRFSPGKHSKGRDTAARNTQWGLLASEVFDDNDTVVVRLETPGMDKADFNLEVLDNYLVIRGEKRIEREQKKGRYYLTECAYGMFERAIPLPEEVQGSKARATYSNGVLRVELPKAVARRRKTGRITVK